jgi:hypothetical protein
MKARMRLQRRPLDADSGLLRTNASLWGGVGRGMTMPFDQLITIKGLKIFDTTLTEVFLNPGSPSSPHL